MGQILVKVRDKSLDYEGNESLTFGVETVITYKSYLYTQDRYELVAQVKEDGFDKSGNIIYKEVPGNPNLNAHHRQIALIKGAVHAVNDGPTQKELSQAEEIEKLKALLRSQNTPPVQETKEPEKIKEEAKSPSELAPAPKKRGPKPKEVLKEQVA